jgi:GntR family transcriptional regulator
MKNPCILKHRNRSMKTKKIGLKRIRGTPLYMQIKDDLQSRIDNAEWKEDDLLPTEAQFCREYQVSTITIREALKLLVQEGRLYRRAGKGTFITKPKFEHRLDSLFSMSRWAERQGITMTTKILKIEVLPCDACAATRLNIEKGTQVTRIDRLRLGDGEPLMFEKVWVPSELCPGIETYDMTTTPLHDILTHAYGLSYARAVEWIEPVLPDDTIKNILGVKKMPLLLVSHTTYSATGRPLIAITSYYRGDRYKFSVEITKEGYSPNND